MLEKQNEIVSVQHKNNSFLATFLSFSYLFIIYGDRSKGKEAIFVSVRKNNDDDNDDDDDDDDDVEEAQEIFSWSGISYTHFDIVHRITRIFMLLPDKLATALEIAKENIPGQTGEVHLNLVGTLYDQTIEDAVKLNYSNSFVVTISELRERLRDITIGFVTGDIYNREIEEFLKRCQPVLTATKIISDWGHSEMAHVFLSETFSANALNNLFDLCSELYARELLSEYRKLRGINKLFK